MIALTYIFEHFVMYIVDFVIAGAGYHMARFGPWRTAGGALLGGYALAIFGGTLPPDGSNSSWPFIPSYWPFINIGLGVAVGELVGRVRGSTVTRVST